jgi:probable HAF family extracellular repeat protein
MWHRFQASARFAAAILFTSICRMDGVSHADCPSYSVDVIALPFCGLPGYGIFPNGLSSNGDITGVYNTCGGGASAFYWSNGVLTPFDVNSETFGVGSAINSKLQIVGNKLGEVGQVGFLYDNGKTIDVGMLPGCNFAEAYAINESSQIVGQSSDVVNGPLGAFLWDSGKQQSLDLPVGPNSIANDINDDAQIVGWMGSSPNPPNYSEAFLWENGKAIPLGIPKPGTGSEAKAISNNGYVCGIYAYPNPEGGPVIRRPFRWKDGVMTELGILPGYLRSLALDVNNDGTVVGYCSNNLPTHAFVWRNGVMTDLNDLIPAELELTLGQAIAINDNGQILCAAMDKLSSEVAVLLSPIPSPIGDINCDSIIDVDDLLGVINAWGDETPKSSRAMPPADFNHDHVVDVDDLLIVINNWS